MAPRPDESPEPAPASSESGPGRFAYEGLDRVLHERARLGILASLAAHTGGLLFNDLKQLCALTDGNLNRHLAVLSEAGLVEVWKAAAGARPNTLYRLTPEGRHRFARYIGVLEQVVADAQAEAHAESRANQRPPRHADGWSPA
jgi:DNA-binding MarR family transcriptional regulator